MRALSPGEVVLVEVPLVRWTSLSRSPRDLLGAVLRRPDAAACLYAMRRLHPQDLRVVADLAAMEMEHQPTVHALLPLYCKVVESGRMAGPCGEEDRDEGCRHDGWGGGGGGEDGGGANVCDGSGARGGGLHEAATDSNSASASSVSGPLAAAQLLRLCLVCQWNAFDSGLFLHQV
jgi:hypothetical protein